MSITFQTQGTTPTGTGTGTGSTSIAPDLPSGLAAGNIMVMFVGAKPDTATITTPAGWTLVPGGSLAGGGGTTGADTGPTLCAAYYRLWQSGDAAPTVSVTSGNSCWAQIFRYSNQTGYWLVEGCNGADSTTGTAWSVTADRNPVFQSGDHVIVGSTIPTDVTTPAQFSAEAITATGATFSAMTELSEPEGTVNNDVGGFIARTDCTAGPSTAAPVYTATAGGTTTNVRGVSIIVLLREVEAQAGGSLLVQRQAVNRASFW